MPFALKRHSAGQVSLAIALLFWSMLLLLPFGRLAGLPVLALSLIGVWALIQQKLAIWHDRRLRLFALVFCCYWLPLVIAAVDAANPGRSWTVALAALRFFLVGYAVIVLMDERGKRLLFMLTAALVAFWSIDALIQAVVGVNLLGMPISPERLNGIFGTTNIKLGPVLAAASPVMLEYARRRLPRWGFPAAFILSFAIILLIGTRAAWVMFAVVALAYLYLTARKHGKGIFKHLAYAGILTGALVLVFYQFSPAFQARAERSLAVLNGDMQGLDEALAYRLPIWKTAAAVIEAHPINGVGARSFRYVYRDFAEPDDVWLGRKYGASHAHQIILEVLSETGVIGLAGLALACVLGFGYWRRLRQAAVMRSLPYALALLAILFPLNTHLAIYSTFWSIVLWWFVIAFCSADARPANGRRTLSKSSST